MRPFPLALCLALLIPACADDGEETTEPESTSTSTSGDVSTSTGSTSEDTTGGGSDTSSGSATTDNPTTSSTSTTNDSTATTSDEPVCGNKIDEPGEYCDQGGVNTEACDEDCTIPKCGDGLLNEAAGEECDDNNYASDDGCSKECVVEYCGDGVVQEGLGEECEDGNDVDFDGCSAECKFSLPCGEAFTTDWCQQSGLERDQYTRCESISEDQSTCFNPEIKYGTNSSGIPISWGDMDVALGDWCASLGFSGVGDYVFGDRNCLKPFGPVIWNDGGDEVAYKWSDYTADGKWYPPNKLNDNEVDCPPGDALLEVTCKF